MSSYTRGKKRDNLVFMAINDVLMYGFKTKGQEISLTLSHLFTLHMHCGSVG